MLLWKFARAKMFVAPHQLVMSWWLPIRDAGYSVELDPTAETYPESHWPNDSYIRGRINVDGAEIHVIAMQGPPLRSRSIVAGEECILVGYGTPGAGHTFDDLDSLACAIGAILANEGATEIAPGRSKDD